MPLRPLLASVLAALVLPAAALGAPVFLVDGHGWGHGIGLAQYGAQGFASRENRSYAWILRHYYRGTALAQTSVSQVRVLLAADRSALRVGSAARFRVSDGKGRTFRLPAGTVELGPSLRVRIGGKATTLASPVVFARGSGYLRLAGRPYRGRLVVRSSAGRLSATNHVRLNQYLYGVVASEMPPSWAAEALKAQAVAARSYAVVSRRRGGTFDLFPDTRSQVYGGVAAEAPRTNAAVDATAGTVVTYAGRVAWTFFHSTSGGRTAAIQDVWNASPIPYLVSVRDPYDVASPYHSWGPLRFTGARLRATLGPLAPPGALLDAVVARNASLRAETVALRGSGGRNTIAGTSFQARLGLRSSWFSLAVLSLAGPRRIEFGSEALLRGIARGTRPVVLEQRAAGTRWQRAARVEPGPNGGFRAVARPGVTKWYRLRSPKGAGLPRRVTVAALVRFDRFAGGRVLAGFVRPALAGVDVVIQRRASARWANVARAVTNEQGRFRARLDVRPGRYRAVARVGHGLVPGVTPTLTVVAG
ncbi:MAG: SpoIID/LytB domain-containing protein [Thermoleophilia bacterium]|nr:SpoIID/LytB domain-containing protein [Thermoleophilia bacterium]